jgi:hypothetical protein
MDLSSLSLDLVSLRAAYREKRTTPAAVAAEVQRRIARIFANGRTSHGERYVLGKLTRHACDQPLAPHHTSDDHQIAAGSARS